MAMELKMLTLASLLTVVLALVGAAALILQRGLRYGFGNRDQSEPLSPWGERALRAHRNMLENLPPFAALVLVAQVAGIANEATAWGAVLFFWGRVAHAVIYIAGVPYLRTAAFVVALAGMFRIARELLLHWSSIGPAV
jgi:uncharacterized MAPEG superfamily protein